MATINDVARLANVSVATVSRVIGNTNRVKPETRSRVIEAIKTLNYQPNILARQLRRKETKSIIVVVPGITNSFFSNVLLGIETIASKYEYQVLLGDTQNDQSKGYAYLDLLKQKQVDGVISLTARMKREYLEEISNQYPVVLACEYLEGSNVPTVAIDNIRCAEKLTQHLINLRHKRIAFLSGPMEIILNRDRLKGFYNSMIIHGMEVDSSLVAEGDFTMESGYQLTKKLLTLERPPTAIFAANDEMAIGSIKAIKCIGWKVPKDVAVVGFDDIKMASIFEPSLTTIAQPASLIGIRAMETLLDLMNQESYVRRSTILKGDLVIRESCGATMI
ncbi:LacI family DNA-binding transcriptional regulator [Ammoniphilus resinae]|uniref:LacI family repressor for deo operon, udp, cdd, tsx, nupC, and nupG n=1 Tax=Ammoniphilus resinae TaxID=861532 RepID=A0ABS4GML7_9BACL|nr:LacI family DNA-binding transcriptional regulator [Ammoniphilus resinae]MBP1931347.1 LacI family repressor for deo operon, udp, cdd, tsx, nupC, and nupG [Ammoniphilus resinae]